MEKLIHSLKENPPEVLIALLNEYSARWRHNSNQIWAVGALFIPLSLSGISLGLDSPVRTLLVGLFSIFLIFIWYGITDSLRVIIDRNWRVYAAVESELIALDPPLRQYGLDEIVCGPPTKRISTRRLRKLIVSGVVFGWVCATTLSFLLHPICLR